MRKPNFLSPEVSTSLLPFAAIKASHASLAALARTVAVLAPSRELRRSRALWDWACACSAGRSQILVLVLN